MLAGVQLMEQRSPAMARYAASLMESVKQENHNASASMSMNNSRINDSMVVGASGAKGSKIYAGSTLRMEQ